MIRTVYAIGIAVFIYSTISGDGKLKLLVGIAFASLAVIVLLVNYIAIKLEQKKKTRHADLSDLDTLGINVDLEELEENSRIKDIIEELNKPKEFDEPVVFTIPCVFLQQTEGSMSIGDLFFTTDQVHYVCYFTYDTEFRAKENKDNALKIADTWRLIQQGLSVNERLHWGENKVKWSNWISEPANELHFVGNRSIPKDEIEQIGTFDKYVISVVTSDGVYEFGPSGGHAKYQDQIQNWHKTDYEGTHVKCAVTSDKIAPVNFYMALGDGVGYSQEILDDMYKDKKYLEGLHELYNRLYLNKQVEIASIISKLKGVFCDNFVAWTKKVGKQQLWTGTMLYFGAVAIIGLATYFFDLETFYKKGEYQLMAIIAVCLFVGGPLLFCLFKGTTLIEYGRKLNKARY